MGDRLLDIQIIWDTFSASYYSLPLMIALNIAFVIIAVSRRKRVKHSGPLLIFGVGALIQIMVAMTEIVMITKNDSQQQDLFLAFSSLSSIGFAVIAGLTPYSFFPGYFLEEKVRKKITWFKWIFSLGTLALLILACVTLEFWLYLENYGGNFIVLASLFGLVPPLFYIHSIFNAPPAEQLLNAPAWWVACGFLVLNATIVPLFLVEDYLFKIGENEWNIYTINYLSFSSLFLLFSRAFFCQPQKNEKIHVINE